MQKPSETKIRKLPLPLRFKLGSDSLISDGLFTLTEKDASEVNVVSVDNDGFASIEIHPPIHETESSRTSLKDIFGLGTRIGLETSKSRGQAKDFGQYRYFRTVSENYAAEVSGTSRKRTFILGRITEKGTIISSYASIIVHGFGTREFSKKELTGLLPKNLSFGQIMKAVLDILRIEGYLERREGKKDGKRGRIREWFKATERLIQAIPVQSVTLVPEQA
jgi:hypothetical protein